MSSGALRSRFETGHVEPKADAPASEENALGLRALPARTAGSGGALYNAEDTSLRV